MTICPKPQLQGGSWREGGLQPFQPFSPPIGPSALTFRLVIPAEGSKGATRSGGLGGRLGPTPLQVVQAGPALPPVLVAINEVYGRAAAAWRGPADGRGRLRAQLGQGHPTQCTTGDGSFASFQSLHSDNSAVPPASSYFKEALKHIKL